MRLGLHRGRCIALLDTHHATAYAFDAVYACLHEDPPVPTLLVLTTHQAPAQGAADLPPTDDYVVLPMDLTEIARRARALAVGAGRTLPPVGEVQGDRDGAAA